jgi:catechol 2,3-dioxygenase-like lactoylglutathione lyase family enzyme
MIDHLSYYATNYEATKRFYEVVLPPLGYERTTEMVATWNESWPTQRFCAFGPPKRSIFWLIEVKHPVSPRHIAFTAPSRAAVDAFHKAALAQGAKDNGAPGVREQYHPDYYAAFVIDPDGNNVEAVCHHK